MKDLTLLILMAFVTIILMVVLNTRMEAHHNMITKEITKQQTTVDCGEMNEN